MDEESLEHAEPVARRGLPLGRAVSGLIAGLMAGVVLGWAFRGALLQPSPLYPVPRQTQRPAEARPARASVPAPKAADTPSSLPEAPPKDAVMVGPPGPPKDDKVGSLPTPTPLNGTIGPFVPDVPGVEAIPMGIHTLEAKVRVIARQFGADVIGAEDHPDDSGPSRQIRVAVPSGQRDQFERRINGAIGPYSVVTLVGDSPSGTGEDTELDRQVAALDDLKKRRDRALIDFYEDSPVLRDLQDQVKATQKRVDEMSKKGGRRLLMSVIVRETPVR